MTACPGSNAHAIYMSIDDSLRRIANQAFFERLTVTDDDAIDAEPGVPFDTLFNPEIQATALARQEGERNWGRSNRERRWFEQRRSGCPREDSNLRPAV